MRRNSNPRDDESRGFVFHLDLFLFSHMCAKTQGALY